ncbi:hypothetical protein EDD15DRAFT_2404082 [Pisolithus albus]|nr:hypothetical protein EDD15DRAFT_2404082 [Pisolithus albus]
MFLELIVQMRASAMSYHLLARIQHRESLKRMTARLHSVWLRNKSWRSPTLRAHATCDPTDEGLRHVTQAKSVHLGTVPCDDSGKFALLATIFVRTHHFDRLQPEPTGISINALVACSPKVAWPGSSMATASMLVHYATPAGWESEFHSLVLFYGASFGVQAVHRMYPQRWHTRSQLDRWVDQTTIALMQSSLSDYYVNKALRYAGTGTMW